MWKYVKSDAFHAQFHMFCFPVFFRVTLPMAAQALLGSILPIFARMLSTSHYAAERAGQRDHLARK